MKELSRLLRTHVIDLTQKDGVDQQCAVEAIERLISTHGIKKIKQCIDKTTTERLVTAIQQQPRKKSRILLCDVAVTLGTTLTAELLIGSLRSRCYGHAEIKLALERLREDGGSKAKVIDNRHNERITVRRRIATSSLEYINLGYGAAKCVLIGLAIPPLCVYLDTKAKFRRDEARRTTPAEWTFSVHDSVLYPWSHRVAKVAPLVWFAIALFLVSAPLAGALLGGLVLANVITRLQTESWHAGNRGFWTRVPCLFDIHSWEYPYGEWKDSPFHNLRYCARCGIKQHKVVIAGRGNVYINRK